MQSWPHIHPSAQWEATAPAPRVPASLRGGALRFECPANGSRLLVTDEATLSALAMPVSRLRCPSCKQPHLLELFGN